jgi:hypothetical protein
MPYPASLPKLATSFPPSSARTTSGEFGVYVKNTTLDHDAQVPCKGQEVERPEERGFTTLHRLWQRRDPAFLADPAFGCEVQVASWASQGGETEVRDLASPFSTLTVSQLRQTRSQKQRVRSRSLATFWHTD